VYRPRKVIDLSTLLKVKGMEVRIVYSCGKYVDVLPANAGKRAAVTYLGRIMDVPLRHILTSGDSGNDIDMLTNPKTANVLVANAESEMAPLARSRHVYHANRSHAAGVVEGTEAFGFWPKAS
jgi:sucrose-phosphate synthase